jgi:hypothetical protein
MLYFLAGEWPNAADKQLDECVDGRFKGSMQLSQDASQKFGEERHGKRRAPVEGTST